MKKTQAIQTVQEMNISMGGYMDSIIEQLEDRYAAGYLSRACAEIEESYSSTSEDYRDRVLEMMTEYDIWEVKYKR